MKTELVIFAILAIISFAIGLWPLGLIFAIILIALNIRNTAKSKNEETEIYKTAAEIEHNLNEERSKER